MTLENQQTAENTEQKELNNPTDNDTVITHVTEISSQQEAINATTPELIDMTTNISNVQNTSGETNITNSQEQNLPVVSNQSNKSLIEIDAETDNINKIKYKYFLSSLKCYGGKICNKIIYLATINRQKSKKLF